MTHLLAHYGLAGCVRESGVEPEGSKYPEKRSSAQKFGMVIGTASFNEDQLAEYCRKQDLLVEQVKVYSPSHLTIKKSR